MLGLITLFIGIIAGAAPMFVPYPYGLIVGGVLGLIGGCVAGEIDHRATVRSNAR